MSELFLPDCFIGVTSLAPDSPAPGPWREDEKMTWIKDNRPPSQYPLFTKRAISRALQQVLAKTTDEDITIEALDSSLVNFKVMTGKVLESADGIDWIAGRPFLDFVPVQLLRSSATSNINYCNIVVMHRLVYRHTHSQRPLGAPPIPPLGDAFYAFTDRITAWRTSPICRQLTETLNSIELARPIGKIVAFGCNSLTLPVGCNTDRNRPGFQHALLLTVKEVLGEKTGNASIEILAQDPAYNDTDKMILAAFGITVIDSPVGFLKVDEESFVFSCSPHVPVRQMIMYLSRPAGMIWNAMIPGLAHYLTTDPYDFIVHRRMNRYYDTYDFPEDFDHFAPMAIYALRGEPASDELYLERDVVVQKAVEDFTKEVSQTLIQDVVLKELVQKVRDMDLAKEEAKAKAEEDEEEVKSQGNEVKAEGEGEGLTEDKNKESEVEVLEAQESKAEDDDKDKEGGDDEEVKSEEEEEEEEVKEHEEKKTEGQAST
ncbi:hypothetical protein BO71DRAFT_431236 [Aspergillus ellipticus CBS 707.79]|uniref:SRR1-like domain-containing protein n=1 Tax=Aspergillus ellipticus CBS 707.79 TaxID=1448320 RepID=A0A319D7D4_9EURO|nr:hypothetical protein BO71DRAFT_431236 [Aspergillus ellipticus CBS 707.79]